MKKYYLIKEMYDRDEIIVYEQTVNKTIYRLKLIINEHRGWPNNVDFKTMTEWILDKPFIHSYKGKFYNSFEDIIKENFERFI